MARRVAAWRCRRHTYSSSWPIAGIDVPARWANRSASRMLSPVPIMMGVAPGAASASAIRAIEEPITRAIWTAGSRSTRPMATIDWKIRTRLDVHVGERLLGVTHVEEPERPPEPLGHVERDVGAGRHFGLGHQVPRRDQHAVDHQEVDHVVVDGPVDLVVGAPEPVQQRPDSGQCLDPGVLVRRLRGGAPGGRTRGHPRRDPSGQRGRRGAYTGGVADHGVYRPSRGTRPGPTGGPRADQGLPRGEGASRPRPVRHRAGRAGPGHGRPGARGGGTPSGRRGVRRQRGGRLGPWRGALVVWEPGRGLNGAVEAGVDHLRACRGQPR